MSDSTIKCNLCGHGCRLLDGQYGICRVRMRDKGKIVSLVYGRVIAENIDPIEKKPLFHVRPGSFTLSIATLGCNFRCSFCQNSTISQVEKGVDIRSFGSLQSPEKLVDKAIATGCSSMSYTYVEPTVFFEFAFDCCTVAWGAGLDNIFVSNGFMSKQVIQKLSPVLTAINIDLKSFSDHFYRKVCGGRLQPVLDSIRLFKEASVWVEVTTLLIPGLNDSEDELRKTARFLVGLDVDIPWHITAFSPMYRLSHLSPTPSAALVAAYNIGKEQGLHHVYSGNRPGLDSENSYCPSCGETIIFRNGFQLRKNRLKGGHCPVCGAAVAGIWSRE